jgi:hypothetical protein
MVSLLELLQYPPHFRAIGCFGASSTVGRCAAFRFLVHCYYAPCKGKCDLCLLIVLRIDGVSPSFSVMLLSSSHPVLDKLLPVLSMRLSVMPLKLLLVLLRCCVVRIPSFPFWVLANWTQMNSALYKPRSVCVSAVCVCRIKCLLLLCRCLDLSCLIFYSSLVVPSLQVGSRFDRPFYPILTPFQLALNAQRVVFK